VGRFRNCFRNCLSLRWRSLLLRSVVFVARSRRSWGLLLLLLLRRWNEEEAALLLWHLRLAGIDTHRLHELSAADHAIVIAVHRIESGLLLLWRHSTH